MFFIVLVIILLGITILRLMAVRQYRLTRTGEAEDSALASLGNTLSNTRMSFFEVIYLSIFILVISQGFSLLGMLVDRAILQLPMMVLFIGLVLGSGGFLFLTVRGKAYRRTEQVLDDHQTTGFEDWVIRKHLAELVHESEDDDLTRAEVARATLEKLMGKENRTGDATRQIMENPEQLRDIEQMKLPGLWRFLRGSLLMFAVFVVVVLYFVVSYFSGAMSYIDLFMNALPVALVLILVLSLCLCAEAPKARKASRKARLGI